MDPLPPAFQMTDQILFLPLLELVCRIAYLLFPSLSFSMVILLVVKAGQED